MKDHYYIGKRSTKDKPMHDGYYGSGTILRNYYKKYGHILGETITKEILEINNSKEENACREKYWVGDLYNTDPMCINLRGGGEGLGYVHSQETKDKIGESNKGKKLSSEQIENLRKIHIGKEPWNKGKHFSEEEKQHMSDAHKGQIPWIKGKHHTEEAKQKISETHKGNTPWIKGKHHTEEARQKNSNAHIGKHMGGDNPFSKKIIRIDIITREEMYFDSLSDAARYMNKKNVCNISTCLRGKTKTAYGYKWSYA